MDIAKEIQEEIALAKLNGNKLVYPSASKGASILVAIGKFMGVSLDSLITSIMAYGERNSLPIQALTSSYKKKHYSAVVKFLW